MFCVKCQSSSRKRHVTKVLLAQFDPRSRSIRASRELRNLDIYNADHDDVFARFIGDAERYHRSGYFPGVRPGSDLGPRVTCQDLQNLSYGSESFDVVLTEDVIEHIRKPELAFREIHRVLKPGGLHIFTIPFQFDRPTLERVDTSGEEDVLVAPAEYHGDAIRGQILAYNTFGIDLFDKLAGDFETRLDISTYRDRNNGVFDSYVFISRKSG